MIASVFLGLVFIPNVLSQQTSDIKVLSYSWYVAPSNGDFIVVGEIQNQGNFIFQTVTLNGTVYASDQSVIASSSTMPYVSYLLPQQKAPFYMDFGNPGAQSSVLSTVSYVDFSVDTAPMTSNTEYSSLSLDTIPTNVSNVVNGAYVVNGFVYNVGNQTANDIRVVGTFYNSTGNVVAVGFDKLNDSLAPDNVSFFTVAAFDATTSLVASITNYTLLVQTATLENSSATAPTPTPITTASDDGTFPAAYSYAIIAGLAAVIVIAVVLLLIRKRKAGSALPPPPPPPPAESQEYTTP